jgi:hypothetical protein
MSQLFANNAGATVSGSLTVGGTALVLSAGTGAAFPSPSGGDFFLGTIYEKDVSGNEVFTEVVKVTARTADSLTIARDFESMTGNAGGYAYPSVPGATVFFDLRWTAYAAGNAEQLTSKDATGGYAGLTLFKLNLKNAANTFTNFFTNATTAARTWTLPDKDGTVAMTDDITGTNSGTNTGDNAVNSLYSGLITNATHTGDATGDTALTVVKINGTQLSTLATGLLKNTTGTGVPSIAVAGTDYQAAQSVTGIVKSSGTTRSAATVRTDYAEPTTALATGILKNTTSTGAHTIATAGTDYVAPGTATTFTAQQTFKEVKDTVHTITDGAAFEIDPANGSIQVVTLGASRTPAATNFEAGQCVLLGIDDGTAYSVTWTTVAPVWVKNGGSGAAPTLATSGYTWCLFWKTAAGMFGSIVGSP